MSQATDFLKALFPQGTPGLITTWRASDKRSAYHTTPDDAARAALVAANAGVDVYYGVGTRREDLGPFKRGGKRDVACMPGLFIDIDLENPHAHKSKVPLPKDTSEAAALLAATGLEPTIIVHSGFGIHAYYLFDQPFIFDTPQATARIYEDLLDALQERVIRAATLKGLHVDRLADCTRILRVPGTKNFKVPQDVRDVVVLVDSGPRHPFQDLCIHLGKVPQLPNLPTPNITAPSVSTTCPPVPIEEVKVKLSKLKDLTKRAMAEKLLKGESYADAERDRAMNTLCAVTAWMAPDNDPEALVEALFRSSHAAWAAEAGATKTLEEEQTKAVDKLRRSQADARAERDHIAGEDKGIKDLLGFATAPATTTDTAPATTADRYSPEELFEACKVARAQTFADLSKKWIIQVGESFYVLTDMFGGWAYTPPQKKIALRGVYDWLKRAPLEWFKYDRKQLVRKDVDDLLGEYCSVAITTEASLNIEDSYYDTTTGIFHEAACPTRAIRSVFHDHVDAWLRALGGNDADLLLDWVATVTDLTSPSCALYLSGPPGTGKSLLANGLARLWTTGTPTEMGRVLNGNFNDDLTKCPLVFADEALPTSWNGKQTSTELRALITSNRRTLARKFLSNSALEGCIRVMMAANNDNLLAFNEDMSPDDIKAMAERFLHIDTTAAGQYLKTLGPDHVAGWVDADIIAEHAMWLKANRQVQRTGRMAVTGHVSRIHQAIATRGTVKGLVVEWLANYLARPSQSIPSTAPIRAGGGQYLVNTKVVTEFWDQHVQSEKVPTTGVVSRVLKGLSTGKEARLGGVRCHEIDHDAVVQWANETGIAEPETLMARVNAPILADDVQEVKPVEGTRTATVHDLKAIIEKK